MTNYASSKEKPANRSPMKQQEKIDAYLMGQLPKAESTAFREALQSDKALAQEVEIRRNMLLAVRQVGRDELRNTLNQIHQEVKPQPDAQPIKNNRIRQLLPWLSTAAAAAVLIFFFVRYQATNTTNNIYQQLYQENYQAYELSLNLRDVPPESQSSNALAWYRQGDYTDALSAFQALATAEPQQTQYQMALAICYIELGRGAEAKNILQKIYDAKDPFLSDEAAWYLGLIALSEEQSPEVERFLRPLAEDSRADHHQSASNLLKTLSEH